MHPAFSRTVRARPVLRRSPLLSRQNHRKETGQQGYKYGYKYGCKFGRSHVHSPTDRIHLGVTAPLDYARPGMRARITSCSRNAADSFPGIRVQLRGNP